MVRLPPSTSSPPNSQTINTPNPVTRLIIAKEHKPIACGLPGNFHQFRVLFLKFPNFPNLLSKSLYHANGRTVLRSIAR